MLITASCHPPVPILCTSTTEKRRQDTSSLVRRVIQVGTSYSLLKVAVIRYVKVLISRMDSKCGHRTFVRGGSGDTSILRSPCQPFTPILRSGDNSTGRFLYSAIRGSLQSDSSGCLWWSHFKNVSLTYILPFCSARLHNANISRTVRPITMKSGGHMHDVYRNLEFLQNRLCGKSMSHTTDFVSLVVS